MQFDNLQLVSLIASIVSLVVGIGAIWLSIVFYRMTDKTSLEIKQSSDRISNSVEKLEKLFDKLYTDTFTMMKDTVTDMRKHLWTEEKPSEDSIQDEVEIRTEEKMEHLKNQFAQQLGQLLTRIDKTDANVNEVQKQASKFLDQIVRQSSAVSIEAEDEVIERAAMSRIKFIFRHGEDENIKMDSIVDSLLRKGFSFKKIVSVLEKLRKQGYIIFDGDPAPASIVRPGHNL